MYKSATPILYSPDVDAECVFVSIFTYLPDDNVLAIGVASDTCTGT